MTTFPSSLENNRILLPVIPERIFEGITLPIRLYFDRNVSFWVGFIE
jgi:hypothetical protein